ncbi:hypothetical protein C8R48DRAFT_734657 [Suillus tomentosus]|nr:hypothetical protein C8R48DRAFT_734657 [Suillus tomentosus]
MRLPSLIYIWLLVQITSNFSIGGPCYTYTRYKKCVRLGKQHAPRSPSQIAAADLDHVCEQSPPVFLDSHKSWLKNADESFCRHRKSLAVLGGDP